MITEYHTDLVADAGNPLTLSNCRKLRELKIYAVHPGTVELNLISSITSTKIQRIAFTRPLTPEEQDIPDHPNWSQLDNLLCQLVDRLDCGLRLEVEFRALNAQEWWSGELGFEKYLPWFHEKGGRGN